MQKILCALIFLAVLLLPAAPVYALNSGALDGRVIIGQDFTLKSGDALNGDLVVIGGAVTIEKTASVRGDVVVIGGSLKLDGETTGSAVVIGGVVGLGAQASITGDLVTVGGTVQRAEGSHVGGNVVTNLPPPTLVVPVAPTAAVPPVPPPPGFHFDFGPFGKAAGVLLQAIGLAALAMLLTVFLHPQLDRVGQALTLQPFMAGSMGLLTVVLAPITLVILSITLILIPVALAAVVLLILAWLFGVVAFGMEVGDRFTKAIHRTWEPVLSTGFGTFLLCIVVGMVNLVPCVGWLAPLIVGFVGLGAAVMTLFGTRQLPRTALTGAGGAAGGAAPVPPAA
jgi:hypothetical protein